MRMRGRWAGRRSRGTVRHRGAQLALSRARCWMDLAGDKPGARSLDTIELFADAQHRTRQLARAGLGYDADDIVVRNDDCRAGAIGHTGFTGTSLWIDPEQDLYIVSADQPRASHARQQCACRPSAAQVHDAVVDAVRG